MRWCWALIFVVVAATCIAGCKRRPPPDDLGPEPVASAKPLPALVLTDDTPDLMLTWVDAKGEAHIADKIADVPFEGRDQVRVVVTTKEEGTGALFYVANLTNKNADQAYPVVTVSRDDWDAIIAKRRVAARPPEQADPAGAGSAAAPSPGTVVVYGADWCDACHQAMAFLKQRGIPAIEKNIEADPEAEKEMRAKLRRAGLRGSSSIPIIDVGGKIFVGFDPRAIEAAVRARGAAL
jgi:glutaredoxin